MAVFTIGVSEWRKTFFGTLTAEQLTAGAHTVTVSAGGILDTRESSPNEAGRIDGILGLGQATVGKVTGAAWTVNVNGSLQGVAVVAPAASVSAIGLYNGFGATVNKVNVGADGTAYGRDYGLYTTARAAVVNNGVIGGELGALVFDGVSSAGITALNSAYGAGKVGTNLATTTLAIDATAATATAVSAANNAVIAANITVTNGAAGLIYAGSSDTVPTTGTAIKNLGATGLVVTNSGVIIGGTESLSQASVAGNVGNLDAAIYSAGRLTLTNTATASLVGSVATNWHSATITNAGLIYSGIEQRLATVTVGSVEMFDTDLDGLTNDTLKGAVGAVDVTTLAGLRVTNSGYIVGFDDDATLPLPSEVFAGGREYAIIADDAKDVITNTGFIGGDIYLAGGADSISSTGSFANINGDIFAGAGNDTITNAGNMEKLYADEGNDVFTNSKSADMIYMGNGNDTVTNATSGTMSYVMVGAGDDSINNAGSLTAVYGDAGNDVLTNSKTISQSADMGDGNDVISNTATGTITQVLTGAGNDRLTNAGGIGGNNIILPQALLDTPYRVMDDFERAAENGESQPNSFSWLVSMGDGNDVLINTGTIPGYISMGAGNDTVTGGANREFVFEQAGADNYVLGAGRDKIFIETMDSDKDTLDGGLGIDLLVISDNITAAYTIDLAANTIRLTAADTLVPGNTDVILNIEQVIASNGFDSIQGSIRAESLAGAAGADTIIGGGGRDVLIGGEGNDVFVFKAASESTFARTGRDLITDFDQDADLIQLTFDANTTNNGTARAPVVTLDAFDYAGIQYGNFTKEVVGEAAAQYQKGELRYHYEGGNTILRGDTNGDGVADFAIELRGQFTLASDDFLFELPISVIG